ncbi:MAG: membrane protein insertase YidC [Propionibacterium sp.]|nr:membrane protein insertase YidC [Propionibacterium sp.]MDN6565478.1 membrane protein insertase YidC [Actinomyces sp.]MDN6793603.1 membrane protein insertase YidC [Propionibacterium sp.]
MWEKVLHPFAVGMAWLWVKIHEGLSLIGLGSGSGIGWVLSIVVLTLLVRVLILPLFLRQIKSTRGMQAVQPELQKIQAKYKGKKDTVSRQKMAEETQALYKKHGTSPFSSCMPLLVQMPFLFALYRAIFAIKPLMNGTYTIGGEHYDALGPITRDVALEIDSSSVLGVPLSHTLTDTLKAGAGALEIIAFVVMIVLMVGMQFLSIRLSMTKNMPPQADPNNPMVRSQKMMMYVMPAMFIFTGIAFQMGLLVYMVTTTAWSWGQQIWTIKYMPTPGAPAYKELVAKRQKAYREWAKPLFLDYDRERAAVADSPEALEELNTRTLTEVERKAKGQRVASDFPEAMGPGERVTVYRNLSSQEWTVLPDEMWMRGVRRATEKSQVQRAQNAAREQPRRLSREQRRQQALREEEDARQAERREARRSAQARPGANLSAEEIERRRQERRQARRSQGKKKPQAPSE